MKINNISNNNINNKTSFSGIGGKTVDGMVKASESIAAAGFVATFIAQDGIGSIIPRIATGLTRNSDKTGKLNYKFASLEACRELLTGPPVMLLPIATLGFAQKYIGKSLKSPVSIIESLSETLKNVFQNNKTNLSDAAQIKQEFYNSGWDSALRNTCGRDYNPNKGLIEELTTLTKELESAPKKVKGNPKARTAKVILGEITSKVSEEIKRHADVKGSFGQVAYVDSVGKTSKTSISAFANHLTNFYKDALSKVGDLKTTSLDNLIKNLGSFTNKRIKARVATNFLTMGAVLLYSVVVPKLYKKLNKTNPGLIGLIDEPEKKCSRNIEPQKVDYQAFDKLKQAKNEPAFKGIDPSGITKTVKKEGVLRKFANAFEFNGINMSFPAIMSFMGLGVLAPRVINAYDKHDKREILTRDILTIGALVFGAKALLKNIANTFEKKTGIVLTEKSANYFQKSKSGQLLDRLRPFGGNQVFSNGDIALKYTNVDQFKGGFEGFCKFISETGGNLAKFFANDKVTKENIENMLGKTLDKTTSEEIMNAITDKKNAKYIENIINVFKKADNTFVKKSKSIIGVFDFISTFLVVPAFMIFLQKFNEKVTKSAIAKEQAEKKAVENKFNAVKLTAELNQPEAAKLNMK